MPVNTVNTQKGYIAASKVNTQQEYMLVNKVNMQEGYMPVSKVNTQQGYMPENTGQGYILVNTVNKTYYDMVEDIFQVFTLVIKPHWFCIHYSRHSKSGFFFSPSQFTF